MELLSAGENALILYLGHETSPAIAARVQAACAAIELALAADLVDLVPALDEPDDLVPAPDEPDDLVELVLPEETAAPAAPVTPVPANVPFYKRPFRWVDNQFTRLLGE